MPKIKYISSSRVTNNPKKSSDDTLNKELYEVIKQGNDTLAKKLLKSDKIDINYYGDEGSFIQLAVKYNRKNIAEMLIKHGVDLTEEDEEDTLMHLACENNVSIDLIELLLDNGCPDNNKNDDRETPIRLAYKKGHREIVDYLAQFVDDATDDDDDDETILNQAIKKGDIDSIKKYSSYSNISNGNPDSLYYAVHYKQPYTIKMLLKNRYAKYRKDWGREWGPLHEACRNEYVEGVKILLKSKYMKKCINWANRDRRTALHEAMDTENLEIMTMLVENGANVSCRDNEYLLTPLQEACNEGKIELVKVMIGKNAVSEYDYDDYHNGGPKSTEILCALENGHIEIAKLLIESGKFKLDGTNDDDELNTPLHVATSKGYYEIVKLLLENGVSVNAQDTSDDTALHIAVRENNKKLIKLLVKYGADVEKENFEGKSPLDIAEENENEDLVKILSKKNVKTSIQDKADNSKKSTGSKIPTRGTKRKSCE